MDIAHDESDGAFDSLGRGDCSFQARLGRDDIPLKAQNAEVAPAGGEIRIRHLANSF